MKPKKYVIAPTYAAFNRYCSQTGPAFHFVYVNDTRSLRGLSRMDERSFVFLPGWNGLRDAAEIAKGVSRATSKTPS